MSDARALPAVPRAPAPGQPLRTALVGLAATVLVALGTVGLSYTGFGTTRADATLGGRTLGRALMLVGLTLTVVAWWGARRLPGRWHWPLLALWSLPLLFAPPVLSRDLYAYAEQGFLVLSGFDPYTVGMGTRGGPFADLVDVYWQGTTTVYPPGVLALQSLVVQLTGAHPYWTVVAMRLPAVAGLVLMGLLVPRLSVVPGDAARWAVLLNPVVLLHVVGGGHNDALAAGLAVAAVRLGQVALRRHAWGWLAGCFVAGLAATVKQPLALVVVGLAALATPSPSAGRGRWSGVLARTALGTAVAGGTFALVTWVTGLGYGWLAGSGSPSSVKTSAPASLLADVVSSLGIATFQAVLSVTGPLLVAAGAGAVAWWAVRTLLDEDRPRLEGMLAFLAGAFPVVVVALPGFQVWYLLWGAAYAAALGWFERYPRAVLGIVAFCLAVGWLTECVGVPPLWATMAAGAVGVATPIGWRSLGER